MASKAEKKATKAAKQQAKSASKAQLAALKFATKTQKLKNKLDLAAAKNLKNEEKAATQIAKENAKQAKASLKTATSLLGGQGAVVETELATPQAPTINLTTNAAPDAPATAVGAPPGGKGLLANKPVVIGIVAAGLGVVVLAARRKG